MYITPSVLRKNIYKLLDRVLETGVPLEISRKGKRLMIVPENADKLGNLRKHSVMTGNPEEIVHQDWSDEWNG